MNIHPQSFSDVRRNVSCSCFLYICLAGILLVSVSQSNVVQAFLVIPASIPTTTATKCARASINKGSILQHCNSSNSGTFLVAKDQGRRGGGGPSTSPFGSISTSPRNSYSCTTRLYATPQKRIARRDMKKRPNRRGRRSGNSVSATTAATSTTQKSSSNNFFQNNNIKIIESEIRPLVRAKKVEAGEDYWIDETELQKSLDRKMAIQNRKANEGEISKDKLKTEVVAPYKQNWIGLFSVAVIVLATIVNNFPELLNSPVIQIPDL